jgi:hypothetical protein
MILKPIDDKFICPVIGSDIDDILKNIFDFNNINFIETDVFGSQINPDPYCFFAINRILLIRPIAKNSINKYSSASYDCILTIAKPSDASIEIESTNVDGQFEIITKQFLNLEFINTLRSYFRCCGYNINIQQIRPIWNSTQSAKRVNHSGVEINFTAEI